MEETRQIRSNLKKKKNGHRGGARETMEVMKRMKRIVVKEETDRTKETWN